MDNMQCKVAQDLMPLLIDQVASEESRALVESHVAQCEPCAQVYQDMQAKMPEKKDVAEEVSFSAAMRQLRRTVGWKRIKVIAICTVILLVLLVAGICAQQYLFEESNRKMPLDWYKTNVSRTSDGIVLISIYYPEGYVYGLTGSNGPNPGIAYISADRPIIPHKSSRYKENPEYDCYVSFLWKDGRCLLLNREDGSMGKTIKEIRKGIESDYEVIYKEGDDIPLCPPALEAYLREKYKDEILDITFVSFSANLVPEWK